MQLGIRSPMRFASGYDASVIQTAGLLGYWKLEEPSGSVAFDSSGNGHDGVYVGTPTLGQAALIDGAGAVLLGGSDSIKVRNGDPSFFSKTQTIEVWCKHVGTPNSFEEFWSEAGSVSDEMRWFAFAGGASTGVRYVSDGNHQDIFNALSVSPDNNRHLFHFVNNNGGIQVWMDGSALTGVNSFTIGNQTDATSTALIGKGSAGGWKGYLQKFALYGVALDAVTIANRYEIAMGA